MYARAACNALLGLLDLLTTDGMDRWIGKARQGKLLVYLEHQARVVYLLIIFTCKRFFLKLTLVCMAS